MNTSTRTILAGPPVDYIPEKLSVEETVERVPMQGAENISGSNDTLDINNIEIDTSSLKLTKDEKKYQKKWYYIVIGLFLVMIVIAIYYSMQFLSPKTSNFVPSKIFNKMQSFGNNVIKTYS